MALDFADIITDLVERIPYLTVIVSTLLPRFDSEERAMMSNPNNVRKVMNVEISSRLTDNGRVVFINNDTVLEWWKDEVKRNRLFGSDGHQLTAYGFSVMLDHWMATLKDEVSKANLKPEERMTSSSTAALEEHVLSPRSEAKEGAEVTTRLSQVSLDSRPMEEHVLAAAEKGQDTEEILLESEGPEQKIVESVLPEKSSEISEEPAVAVEQEIKPEDVPLGPDDGDSEEHKVEEVRRMR